MLRLHFNLRDTFGPLILAVAAFIPHSTYAQTLLDPHSDIHKTYDFDPTSMTFDEQAKRAPSISALWGRYAKNPEKYAEALRIELRALGNRELLYCDGGMLLLNKSKDKEDQALGLTFIKKCSLAEIQQTPYFYTTHSLAMRGVDIFDLQVRILSKPKYSVFIVQHSLSLGQDYAFLYPFLVQNETLYVPKLLKRLSDEKDEIAQKSLVRALWYAATLEAEVAIRKFASEGSPASPAMEDARKLVESLDTARRWKDDNTTLKSIYSSIEANLMTSELELRAKRRTRMRSISDEALYDLDAYTILIYRSRRGT